MYTDNLGSEARFGQRDPIIVVREIAIKRTSRGRPQHTDGSGGRFELCEHIRYRDIHFVADISDRSHEGFRWRRYFLTRATGGIRLSKTGLSWSRAIRCIERL